jgi:hypothetical protein
VNARWSVVIRRVSETVMYTLPFMALLFIPILFGIDALYHHWADYEHAKHDPILVGKLGWLNVGFFKLRAAIYFAIWSALAWGLYRSSMKQDADGHSAELEHRFKAISAPGMFVFALTTTFAVWDWSMSMDPHWYSTIFGVCFFAGSFLAILAAMALLLIILRKKSVLDEDVSIEHYHDIGKLIFGFVIFWTYTNFSQFFLIWYGNIPEETLWFRHRWEHGWKPVSLLLIFGHFIFPFLFLLSRVPKRRIGSMLFIACWILFIHWVDMYWQVMPNMGKHFLEYAAFEILLHIGCFCAIGGFVVAFFWNKFCSAPIVPVKDPFLQKSINFVNM